MSLPATENFTASDGTQIGDLANWTLATVGDLAGNMDIQSNGLAPDQEYNTGAAYWDADSFDNDQYAQATVVAVDGTYFIGLAVRVTASGNAYTWMADRDDQGYLEKFVAGNWTLLTSGGAKFAVDDALYMQVQGTAITCKINGGTDLTDTDSSIASGSAGVSDYHDGTTTRLDNWEGGNLGGAPPAAPELLALLGVGG